MAFLNLFSITVEMYAWSGHSRVGVGFDCIFLLYLHFTGTVGGAIRSM